MNSPLFSRMSTWKVLHMANLIELVYCQNLYTFLTWRGHVIIVLNDRIQYGCFVIFYSRVRRCIFLLLAWSCNWLDWRLTNSFRFFRFFVTLRSLDPFIFWTIQLLLTKLSVYCFESIDKIPKLFIETR